MDEDSGAEVVTKVEAEADRKEAEAKAEQPTDTVDRSAVIGAGVRSTATWSLRLIIIGFTLYLAYWLLGQIWVGVRPVLLAIIFSTLLWPVVKWLRRHRWPDGLASIVVLLAALVLVSALLVATARPIVTQSVNIANRAADGIQRLQQWVTGPPLNLPGERIDAAAASVADWLRSSADQIALTVLGGVSTVSSTVVTAVLVLVLMFFFLKDGDAFVPWLRRQVGTSAGGHLTEVLIRSWNTLGSFVRIQVLVSFVDAVLIGIGLVILGVPLAAALAVLTFIAGFVPIVGAIAAGAIAVLVALVTNGPTTALLVLALVLLVQQVESNVLQPLLQGRSLDLHPAIVLLAVTAGSTLYGIIGAFLAVPVVAVAATMLRYLSDQVAVQSGQIGADDLSSKTSEGTLAARRSQRAGEVLRERWRQKHDRDRDEPVA